MVFFSATRDLTPFGRIGHCANVTRLFYCNAHDQAIHSYLEHTVNLAKKGSQFGCTNELHLWTGRSGGPGVRFSKVPKLLGRISGNIILFVSSKRKRLEAQDILTLFFPLQHAKRPALQN